MSTGLASETAPGAGAAQPSSADDNPGSSLVMQLIVDRTLLKSPTWTLGPMMAQAAHATSAVVAQTFDHPRTQAYLAPPNVPHMRKIVLKSPAGVSLRELSKQLEEAASASRQASQQGEGVQDEFPQHHLWIEQPEDIPTVLAVAPNSKPATLKKVLDKCSLLRS